MQEKKKRKNIETSKHSMKPTMYTNGLNQSIENIYYRIDMKDLNNNNDNNNASSVSVINKNVYFSNPPPVHKKTPKILPHHLENNQITTMEHLLPSGYLPNKGSVDRHGKRISHNEHEKTISRNEHEKTISHSEHEKTISRSEHQKTVSHNDLGKPLEGGVFVLHGNDYIKKEQEVLDYGYGEVYPFASNQEQQRQQQRKQQPQKHQQQQQQTNNNTMKPIYYHSDRDSLQNTFLNERDTLQNKGVTNGLIDTQVWFCYILYNLNLTFVIFLVF